VLLRRARIGGHLCYVRGVTHEGLFSPTTRKLVSKVMGELAHQGHLTRRAN
jgi:hypothetical protein